jgi:predicted Zn-dependent peptidase
MYDQYTLPNGLRIIAEKIPHFRSVSVGLWIGSGSQYETRQQGGISHFIEHMLFKGTKKRTAREIAEAMDAVGGQLNAFTSKECTCFYAKVVDENLPLAMDVITDIVLNSVISTQELEKEKGVILEEISMAEDSPEDLVSELIMLAQFGDQPLARPILGTEESVGSLTRAKLLHYYKKFYRPENAVLALAGNYDWENVLRMSEEFLGGWEPGEPGPSYRTRPAKPQTIRREKEIEQLHLTMAYPGVPQDSDEIYPLSILNSVLGGAMSSRLFQSIREERGLAYTVYSYPASYSDSGIFAVYAGTSIEYAPEVLKLIRQEVEKITREGLTKQEFDQARAQLKGSYILGLESTSSRMNALGRRKLLLNAEQTEEEVIAKIDAITYDQVFQLTRKLLSAKPSVSLVGKGAENLEV